LALHVVSAALFGCAGTPALQVSLVQGLPSSAGTSLLSATEVVPPWPSQTTVWQSPVVWLAVGVFCGSGIVPQMLAVQTGAMQALPVAGQSLACEHGVPRLTHIAAPAAPWQPVPAGQAIEAPWRRHPSAPVLQVAMVLASTQYEPAVVHAFALHAHTPVGAAP
jgi:hypothetical protein